MERASTEQLRAIRFGPGRMMVLAGPGAGKTFVITHRILYLIRSLGISPETILVITFTKAAAVSMRSRFLELSGPEGRSVCFGTFHAIFYQLIKEKYSLFKLAVLSEPEKRRLIMSLTERFYPELTKAGIMLPLSREATDTLIKELADQNRYLPKEHSSIGIPGKLIREMKSAYQAVKKELHKIDFSDMETEAMRILSEDAEMRKRWQARFRYILIDEFQDISGPQYEIVSLLAQPENNLFVVGDDDQSIYGFRGASPSVMKQFEEDGVGMTETVNLKINYRSTERIVKSSLCLIKQNKLRYPKDLSAFSEGGKEVEFHLYETKEEEIRNMVREISSFVLKDHRNASDIAVLCRTGSDFPYLGQVLSSYGISFRAKEKIVCIFEQDHVEDLLAYLHLSTGPIKRSDLLRVMNRPVRFLSRTGLGQEVFTREELMKVYSDTSDQQKRSVSELIRDLDLVGKCNPYAALNLIRKKIGYDRYLKETIREEEELRKTFSELDEVMKAAKNCNNLKEFEDLIGIRIREFHDHLAKVTEKNTKSPDAVTLCTMHGSKGLEYKKVYIPFCVEGVTPHKKAVGEEALEEERRLFYVAMTRAKEELVISAHKQGAENRRELSRFVGEAGLIRCETVKDVL